MRPGHSLGADSKRSKRGRSDAVKLRLLEELVARSSGPLDQVLEAALDAVVAGLEARGARLSVASEPGLRPIASRGETAGAPSLRSPLLAAGAEIGRIEVWRGPRPGAVKSAD